MSQHLNLGPSAGRMSVRSMSQVSSIHKPRSRFDLSHNPKGSMNFDLLIPLPIIEVLPGDTYTMNTTPLMRLATQVVPIMDNLYVDFFYFFVPNRLVWDNWESFITGENGAASPSLTIPQFVYDKTGPSNLFTHGTLADYMYQAPVIDIGDWPPNNNISVSALGYRAYWLIWNEWFRDQNLQALQAIPLDDGPDTASDYPPLCIQRGKRHDRFTSCLPWPQKGTSISPLIVNSPLDVVSNGLVPIFAKSSGTDFTDGSLFFSNTTINHLSVNNVGTAVNGLAKFGSESGLQANVDSSLELTINGIREAWMIQMILETDARYGTRYVESIYGHFGVVSPDFRLQRPEYLGGGETRINIHAIAQTSVTSGSNPAQGTLAGVGLTSGGRIGFSKTFVEHGMIIGLMAARADITYQQGFLNKFALKHSRFDFYWPELANLGEQPVENRELYWSDVPITDSGVFGYQQAWSDYRYFQSSIHGDLKSNFSTPLDFWHQADKYASLPTLGATWIASNTPISRSIAVTPTGFTSTATLIYDIFQHLIASRPLPVQSVPARLERF